jgi:uncharacterized protein (TIGR03435 family)
MRAVPFLTLVVACAAGAFAQARDSALRFESAIIKTADNPDISIPPFVRRWPWEDDVCTGGPGTRSPGVLKCRGSFAILLGRAYGLNPAQFSAENWMNGDWFRIEAKVPAGTTLEQLPVMERNLLADRFDLAVHFLDMEVTGYEMSITNGGPKFKPAARPLPKTSGPGKLRVGYGGGQVMLIGLHSMAELAGFLSDFLDWPVVDATGLAGTYAIDLRFETPTPWIPGLPGGGTPAGPPPIQAVHEQLGLVLERTKIPTRVLIVDRVEKKPHS